MIMIYFCKVYSIMGSLVTRRLPVFTQTSLGYFHSQKFYFQLFENQSYQQNQHSTKILSKPAVAMKTKQNNISKMFSDFGFDNKQIKMILRTEPNILYLKEKKLSSNLIAWLNFRLDDKHLTNTLAELPELLLLNPEYVDKRTKELMTVFTQRDIGKLLRTSPTVFLDDWEEIMSKMQYMVHYMQVEQKSVVKYEALQFDLDFIKIRHRFLLYCGVYKAQKKMKTQVNPLLGLILHKNVQDYLKLSGLCEEEYNMFCKVHKKMEAQMDEMDDDESNIYNSESDNDANEGDLYSGESDIDSDLSDSESSENDTDSDASDASSDEQDSDYDEIDTDVGESDTDTSRSYK